MVGLQAQDAPSARLGIRSRTKGLTVADMERERLEDRSFVRAWAMRYTIHLVTSEDFPWIRDLVAPPHIAASHKRMVQEGLSPENAERARRVIRKLLEGGPVTRAEMQERIATKGITAKGRQAWVHLLGLMTYEGEIVTGPYAGKQETMVLLCDWLPGKKPRPPKDPAAELARRYLLGHGPASIDDFRWWSSLRAADARAGFTAIGDELVEEGPGVWRHRSQKKSAAATKTVHLLPAFDHYYLGYRDRSHVVTSAGAARMSRGGFFFNFVASDGGAVALWKLVRRKGGFDVRVEPFARRMPARAAIEREVADIGRFLGADVSLVSL